VPFCDTLDSGSRWVIFSPFMAWEELEETYAPLFNPTTGAPAEPVRLAFGALFIKQRLGLTDEETVEQIRENAYMQSFLGFAGYSSNARFDPLMMVHFRKRFSEEELSRINDLIAKGGQAMVMEAVTSTQDDDDTDDPDAGAGTHLIMCLAMARLPPDGAQKHFADRNGLATGRFIAARISRLSPAC
jgi:hypothetical protein